MKALFALCGIILIGLLIGYVTRPVSYGNVGKHRGDSSHIRLRRLPISMSPKEFARLFFMRIATLDRPNDDWRDMWVEYEGSQDLKRERKEEAEWLFYVMKIKMIESGFSERDIVEAELNEYGNEQNASQRYEIYLPDAFITIFCKVSMEQGNQGIYMLSSEGSCMEYYDYNSDMEVDSADVALARIMAKHSKAKDILSRKSINVHEGGVEDFWALGSLR
ncbi:MAG: hypothetical protein ABIR47_04170 [Candidatus Kapaibacterium sp.]